jgi:hypothetical protein
MVHELIPFFHKVALARLSLYGQQRQQQQQSCSYYPARYENGIWLFSLLFLAIDNVDTLWYTESYDGHHQFAGWMGRLFLILARRVVE